jgi:hypothetical protein
MRTYKNQLPICGAILQPARREPQFRQVEYRVQKERPQYSCNSREPVKARMPASERKTSPKATAPGLVTVYEAPAQIGFAVITSRLQIKAAFLECDAVCCQVESAALQDLISARRPSEVGN